MTFLPEKMVTALLTFLSILCGLMTGEIFLRLFFKVPPPKLRKSKRQRRDSVYPKVKTSERSKLWKFLYLKYARLSNVFRTLFDTTFFILTIVITLLGISTGVYFTSSQHFLKEVLTYAMGWFCIRSFCHELFWCSDDIERLRKVEKHHLGEGMAWSYWCGLLKILFYKQESSLLFSDTLREYSDRNKKEFASEDFLILLPESCDFPKKFSGKRIETLGEELVINIPHKLERILKRKKIGFNVYRVWTEDMMNCYNVIFESPNIITTCMGPNSNGPDKRSAVDVDLRRRNLRDFKTNLKKLFKSFDNSIVTGGVRVNIPCRFIDIKDEGWSKTPAEYEARLADEIISFLESQDELREVLSSDDCSEYE